MNGERFWVIGGTYTCMQFKALQKGRETILGPFASRDEAKAAWKEISYENSSNAAARFTIAAEAARLA